MPLRQAPHGTLARYREGGCECDACRSAEAAVSLDRDRARADLRFSPEARERLVELVAAGSLLKDAAAAVGVTTALVFGARRRDPEWGDQLQYALDSARPSDWNHGAYSAIRRGCQCSECLASRRKSEGVGR